MAVHELWTGTVSFSLVAIPVQLVSAVAASRISFRMLHAKDYASLSRRMLCPVEGKIVPLHEIVRGFEIAPDKYIVMTREELESVSPERSRAIEIIDFIDIGDVDPVYYGRPYFLVPAKGGEKAYSLLVEVMRETGRAWPRDTDEMIKVIESMRSAFKPERYANERKEKIAGLLGEKAKEQMVESPVTGEEVLEGPGDLVSVLQESVRKVEAAQ